ncbi:hypothetical protein ASPCADRAFT_5899 [Aspergillus carbonarius ITEM 5010]|uniref:Uncharacterized protein n=1 Tax=Aspergillus carbonarius (strain ITEM 5010) TaxID=602072 RepID=A0A1R3RLL6_ASPC5|nr:hypothetical protein ASPCADRAFT_5899 [Aspergillus carbonarius ITEM 5010]
MAYIQSELKDEGNICAQTMPQSQPSANLDSKAHFRMPQSQSQLSKNAPGTHARQYNHLRDNQPRQYSPQHGHHRSRPHDAWGSSKDSGQKLWTCPKCRETMTIHRKSGHVHCKRKDSTIRRIDKWPCDGCGIEMASTLREEHLRAAEHAVNAAVYIPPHPNGKRYIKIKDVRRVYHHIRPIPVKCYTHVGAYNGRWKGGITFVSAEDVENAKASMHVNQKGQDGDNDTVWSDTYQDEYYYRDLYL